VLAIGSRTYCARCCERGQLCPNPLISIAIGAERYALVLDTGR
jgi:hypothetical protein